MTPVLLEVQDAPVPFMGSDGRVHLVYELWMTNFSSADVSVEKVEVLGGTVVCFRVWMLRRSPRDCRRRVSANLRGSWRGVCRRCCFSM